MRSRPAPSSGDPDGPRERRAYNNVRRLEQAAETRERIVAAGSEILHGSTVRDWEGLTIRAVAERAGVNERTVYRHFTNERGLRDAVMRRLEEEAGIDLASMGLADVPDVTARIFEHVTSFHVEPRPELDSTLSEAKQRQHRALLDAIAEHTDAWSPDERVMAAAILDVLWSVATYERLVRDWDLDTDQAVRAVSWVIAMIDAAVRSQARDSPPGSAGSAGLRSEDGMGPPPRHDATEER